MPGPPSGVIAGPAKRDKYWVCAKQRQVLFAGKLREGPYAPSEMLEPGDWLYYVNHSYMANILNYSYRY